MTKVARALSGRSAGPLLALAGLLSYPNAWVQASDEWLTVSETSLEISPGNPLDFSELSSGLVGAGKVSIIGDRLAVAGEPTVRFNCAMLGPGFSPTPGSSFPEFETADRYAAQLRRHGYNLVRFHYVDALLMRDSVRDFDYNPVELRRFQYFMSALKRNGIYWLIDLMSSQNGAIGDIRPHRWSEDRGMRLRAFTDPAGYAHWRRLAKDILTTSNPYTGIAPANDPNTAAVILMNEPSINFLVARSGAAKANDRAYPTELEAPFEEWLQHNRPNVLLDMPRSIKERSTRMANFQTFLTDLQVSVTRKMIADVRSLGYSGPISSFDNWAELNQIPTRRILPFVDMHAYTQVPPGGVRGARVTPAATLADGARYLQLAASARILGRPFSLTEYDQPFWDPDRYESGLVAPAFALLQGWEFICRHSDGPIALAYDGQGLRKDAIRPDGVGLDPVARAAETLAALLILRREIAPARPLVALSISDAEALDEGGVRTIPPFLGILGWIARIGLESDSEARSVAAADLSVPLASQTDSRIDNLLGRNEGRSAELVNRLRSLGALPADNRTDPVQNLWESGDGAVLLEGVQRRLRVRTLLTEALASEAVTTPVRLGVATVVNSSEPALLAITALDGQPIRQSHRLLLILASDARNSGMSVAPDGTLQMLGKLPIQILRTQATLELTVAPTSRWTLAPLRLNGDAEPAQSLLEPEGERLSITLDNSMSPSGPTTYFLLERL